MNLGGYTNIQTVAVSVICQICVPASFNHCLLSSVNLTPHLPFLIDVEFTSPDKILCCSNKRPKHLSGLKQQRSIFLLMSFVTQGPRIMKQSPKLNTAGYYAREKKELCRDLR